MALFENFIWRNNQDELTKSWGLRDEDMERIKQTIIGAYDIVGYVIMVCFMGNKLNKQLIINQQP